jgi:hypothetical protein
MSQSANNNDSIKTVDLSDLNMDDMNDSVDPCPRRCGVEYVASPEITAEPSDDEPCKFQIGDHIYQWCSLMGIPNVFNHHAVVMDVYRDDTSREWILMIADFSNEAEISRDSTNSSSGPTGKKSLCSPHSGSKKAGRIRTYLCPESQSQKWHKVQYEASWWKRHLYRSGTCTAVQSDAPGLVRARVQFLLENQADLLPEYDAVKSNCECVAVWCKTGTWATLQAADWLALTAAGQVKSAVTVAGAVAGAQVSVPAAGLWGWLGYTTQVSLISMHPLLLPAIAAYGVVSAGAPALILAKARQHWKQVTVDLNTGFWEDAINKPEIFVDCITYWSAQYEPQLAIEAKELKEEDINHAKVMTVLVRQAQPAEGLFKVGEALASPEDLGPGDLFEPSNKPPIGGQSAHQSSGQASVECLTGPWPVVPLS